MPLFVWVGTSQHDNWLKKRYWRVRPGKNPAEMLLQHDNTSLRTQEHITKMGWTVLPHPPYGQDLAPLEFHLFGSLKDALRGTHFEDDNSIIEVATHAGQELVPARNTCTCSSWRKAIQFDGEYVEKY
jgi:hypothetical protein